ncbi:MAG: SDR family NAD(P)-dependent oxidoreductase [Phycisphaerae bacterium]|nr:SDR family NAD(P)-dependent oxidoreductase [Phycisphaerae bacterium]
MAMETRDIINIIGPALRGLTWRDGIAARYRFDDSDEAKTAKYADSLEYAPPADATAEQIVADLRAKISDCGGDCPQAVIVPGLGVFVRVDDQQAVATGRVGGKVAVVTGAAQGFGLEIAQSLAAEGATVVLADINSDGAQAAAADICDRFGQGRAIGVRIDVTDGQSVQQACDGVVRAYGGLDLLIPNAGVLKAQSVKTQPEKDFDFVTSVNYKGYFLCVQKFAPVMAVQHLASPAGMSDIIQINSKSGLVGSNRNGAYAGSKFGGVGLTQSFALELIDDGIKVNSICPGNFFDGPLWSDPDNGLFVQYLRTNKIPGAKTIEDVRKGYEAKVPMGRGCRTADVMTAVYYLVDQKYETGQAVPVTGGQVMLS